MNPMIYDKNMAAMRERFPAMAEKVEKLLVEENNEISVYHEKALDESDILYLEKEGRTLYLNGKRCPQETARRTVEYWGEIKRETPFYLVGLGDLICIREILKHTEKNIHVMIYEPSFTIFRFLLETLDISDLFRNSAVGIVVEKVNEQEMNAVIKAVISLANVGNLKTYVNPAYQEFFTKQAFNFIKNVDKESSDIIVGRNTGVRYSAVEADNLFHNIGYLCDGYITTQLCDVIPTDIPAIVVSAGPSLNKNIEELRKAKNRAFIVAVDTAVKPLVNAGIVPDMYVVVDGLKPIELFEFEEARTIPLMPSITSAKRVLANHRGKKIFFFEGEMLAYNLLAMNGISFSSVACGGSVACSAFSLIYKLGFERIILVGQDLAMTGNRTHADGTFKEKMDEIDTTHCLMVEGNCEKKVPTRGDFKLYLDWFNYYIEGCEGIHVINATEGGAKIQNTEIMTLADAIERECKKEVDIAACFDKLQPVLNEECRKRAVEYLNTVPDMFRRLRKEVKKEKENYKKLQRICKKQVIDKGAYLHILNRIKRTTAAIEGHELYQIISSSLSVAEYMISSEQFYEEDDLQAEGLEIARQGIKYMELVDQCIGLLIPLSEETVGKLK